MQHNLYPMEIYTYLHEDWIGVQYSYVAMYSSFHILFDIIKICSYNLYS